MARVIDSLIVTLGLDPSGFTKGQKEAAQAFLKTKHEAAKAGSEIERSSKGAAQMMGELRNQALLLFAAFTGGRGVKEFVADLTRGDTALGRTSQWLGKSAQELNQWRGMARLTGGDVNAVTSSLQGLNQSLLAMRYTGDTSLLPALRALRQAAPEADLAFLDMNGELLKSMDLLPKLREAFKGLDKDTALFIGNQLKLSEDLVYILTLPEESYRRYMKDLERLSKITEQDTKAAAERTRVQGLLNESMTTLGRMVLTTLTPAMTAFTEKMVEFVEWGQKNPQTVTELTSAFVGLSAAITAITFAPLLLGLTKVVALAAAATAAVMLLIQAKKDIDAGWVPGDKNNPQSQSFQKKMDDITSQRDASFYQRYLHGNMTVMDKIRHGFSGEVLPKSREAFDKLYGPGSANQSELGMFGQQIGRVASNGPGGSGAGGADAEKVRAFVEKFGPIAEQISKETGIPVERILGQAGLETGWRVDAPGNNLFGVKAIGGWRGPTFTAMSPEGPKGVPAPVTFRKYGSAEESFRDWSKVLAQDNFRGANASGLTHRQYAQILKGGGYAEAENYVDALEGTINAAEEARRGGGTGRRSARRRPRDPSGGVLYGAPGATFMEQGSTDNRTINNQRATVSVVVNTQATDAQGIARDLKPILDRSLNTGQAQYGLR